MRPVHTITASEMRGINRSAVLEIIRREGAISRSVIAGRLQVSIPTVMRIVEALIEDGLVRSSGVKERSGGRRRPLLEFNGANNLVVGVDMGGAEYYGAVADLKGKILYEDQVAGPDGSAEANYTILVEFIRRLLDRANQTGLRVLGAGVGVPGAVDPDKGIISIAPSLNWTNFPLFSRLRAALDLPVVIENDVNLEALGELWFGSGLQANNLVLLAAGTGMGAGVVINGEVYTGSHFMAGEIGYLLPDRALLGRACSGFGALEQQISISGIVRRAREKLEPAGQEAARLSFMEQQDLPGELTADRVFQAARRGEPWAAAVVAETVDLLAQVVGAAQVFYDPEIILLGGMLSRHADQLIAPVLQRLEGALPIAPNLQASTLGYRAAALGAIVKLMRVTADYYMVQKYS